MINNTAGQTQTSNEEKHWFAFYTKPRGEFKAAEQISDANVSYYLPTITRVKQWSDRKKKVTEPLMRGYIFIFATEKERLRAIEGQAVVRCVFDHGRPAIIPEWQIENLKKVLETKKDLLVKEGLIPGVKVEISDGPFEGVIGVIQDSEQGKFLAVSIDLLNRSVIVHLPKESMYKVINE